MQISFLNPVSISMYTSKICHRIRGVTRAKDVLRAFHVAAFLWSRILAIKNVERYIFNKTIDFIFLFHDTAV